MKFKIFNIKGCKTCKQVLIAISRDDNGVDFMELSAWHETPDGWFYQLENINVDDETLLNRIFLDFSEVSANEFANSMKL